MVKNSELLKKFEDSLLKKEGVFNFSYSLRIFENLWEEGKKLGVVPPKDPMEGIEVDIKIARIVNACSKLSFQK